MNFLKDCYFYLVNLFRSNEIGHKDDLEANLDDDSDDEFLDDSFDAKLLTDKDLDRMYESLTYVRV